MLKDFIVSIKKHIRIEPKNFLLKNLIISMTFSAKLTILYIQLFLRYDINIQRVVCQDSRGY